MIKVLFLFVVLYEAAGIYKVKDTDTGKCYLFIDKTPIVLEEIACDKN